MVSRNPKAFIFDINDKENDLPAHKSVRNIDNTWLLYGITYIKDNKWAFCYKGIDVWDADTGKIEKIPDARGVKFVRIRYLKTHGVIIAGSYYGYV